MNPPAPSRPRSRAVALARPLVSAALAMGLGWSATGCGMKLARVEYDPQATARVEALDLIASAQALEAGGQWDAARAHYARSMEVSPRPAALLGVARCLIESGRYAEAEKCLDDFLAKSPDVREAKFLKEQAATRHERRKIVLAQSEQQQASDAATRAEWDRAAKKPDQPKSIGDQVKAATPSQPGLDPKAFQSGGEGLTTLEGELEVLERSQVRAEEEPLPEYSTQPLEGDAPYFRRWSALERRRWTENNVDGENYNSDRDLGFAEEALLLSDPEFDRKTVRKMREELELKPEKLALPADDDLQSAFFGVGIPAPDRDLPRAGLAGDARFYVDRGRALSSEGKLDDAKRAFMEAIARDPRDPVARVELGYIYERTGETDKARDQHEQAIALSPRMARAHYRLGNSHLVEGFVNKNELAYERAIAAYDVALEVEPDFLFALHNKGAALLELGRWREAKPLFEACAKIDPGYTPTFRNLGIIAEKHEKDLPRAVEQYRHYLKIGGRDIGNVEVWIREIERQMGGR